LFVTLFAFAPALKTNSEWPLHPDTLICSQLNFCTMTDFWLRDSLYRDTRIIHKACAWTAKSAPWFVPPRRPAPSLSLLQSGSSLKTPTGCFSNARPSTGQFLNARPWLVPGLYPDSTFLLTAFMPKPTQTTLYCRAVRFHCRTERTDFLILDNLS